MAEIALLRPNAACSGIRKRFRASHRPSSSCQACS